MPVNDGPQSKAIADSDPIEPTLLFQDDEASLVADGASLGLPERIGRYHVEKILGKGGFGSVYLAHDDQLQRLVAVKVPHARLVAQTTDADAYLTEARTVANLDHPNIVPVHDVGSTDQFPCYVVSKYIDGTDLATRLKQGRLSLHEAVELVATVAQALHHAHKQGLVHRDIKPGNILLDKNGKPFVGDFGLALREQDVGKGPRYAGTPAYMSPEQARGEGHRVDGRSDIFSLGVVFYELLVGRRPFRGQSQEELLEQITSVEAKPPRQIDDAVPKELDRICLKTLSKRASERYSSARDLADDLLHFLAESPAAGESTATNQARSESNVETVAPTPPTPPPSDSQPIRIVPKGLRSFNAVDADFFLELLPGPRDRDGLPDSIRFWKTRIESTDPDAAFSVGLIYGPSGCGKSSLVKAGLLPRLAKSVTTVYVEATCDETETRVLKGLQRQVSELPANLDLSASLAALRRGRFLESGQKVLVVLDQFEQWLHARRNEGNSDLVQALRHCDGVRVQCVVMVRDDFWMAASRFMRDLEINLLEGRNAAAVDLFPVRHAQKVLAAFGRAFGELPPDPDADSKEQRQFIEQSVSGLAQEGKVISVRLALFAEMVKGKPWTPATLREVGGTSGIGLAFLEETFTATTAPPQHRLHQKGAQAVLKALLPESGTDIKGHMRSAAQLLELSGYADHPRDFEDLVEILDREIRLITPTDPEGAVGEDGKSRIEMQAGQQYYQLTHDYLVSSLRDWLTRKQRETRRGRAELLLAERASLWSSRCEPRFLPSITEWCHISLWTRRRQWTQPQREMMRAATRRQLIRGGWTAALLLIAGLVGGLIWRDAAQRQKAVQVRSLIERLLVAEPRQTATIISQLHDDLPAASPGLQEIAADAERSEPQRLRARMALLSADSSQLEPLYERLLRAPPDEFLALRDVLAAHRERLGERLWGVLADASADAGQRFNAGVSLAAFESASAVRDDERFAPYADFLTRQLLEAIVLEPGRFEYYASGLRPVRAHLLSSLNGIFLHGESTNSRAIAASLLGDYASDRPDLLAELIMEADPQQFQILFARLQDILVEAPAFETTLRELLQRELAQKVRAEWDDPPLPASLSAAPVEVRSVFEEAGGIVNDRFAFCQTMKFATYLEVIERLRGAGYRPLRTRPFSAEDGLRVAAVWLRDGRDWQFARNTGRDELAGLDRRWREQGYVPTDIAAYDDAIASVDASPSYFVTYALPIEEGADARLVVDGRALDPAERVDNLMSEGFLIDSEQVLLRTARPPHISQVWKKWEGSTAEWQSYSYPNGAEDVESVGSAPPLKNLLQVDILFVPSEEESPLAERYKKAAADAETRLKLNTDDKAIRHQLASAYLRSGRFEEAVAEFTTLLQPENRMVEAYAGRARSLASLGRVEEAEPDLRAYSMQTLTNAASLHNKLYLAVFIELQWGRFEAGLGQLEQALTQRQESPQMLYDAACLYAVASGLARDQNSRRANEYATRAVELLQKAVAGQTANPVWIDEPDLASLRSQPDFVQLVDQHRPAAQTAGVFHRREGITAEVLYDRNSASHLTRSRQAAAAGARPYAIAALWKADSRQWELASVWHRPLPSTRSKARLARRQANAAVTLLRLWQVETAWDLLRQVPDPLCRTQLIHRLASLKVDPRVLVQRLDIEADVSARRALILSLGALALESLNAQERQSLLVRLGDWYEHDPDPGIHGAAKWTLRKWGRSAQLARLDRHLVSRDPVKGRRWYRNSQGQTLSLFRLPVMQNGQAGDWRVAIATEEVTQDQFQQFLADHPKEDRRFIRMRKGESQQPVTGMTWYQAMCYCRWLSEKEGLSEDEMSLPPVSDIQGDLVVTLDRLQRCGYRLPTLQEWRTACGAGSDTRRFFGDDPDLLPHYAWFLASAPGSHPQPVALLKPNDLGLFDMLGNVAEKCINRYGDNCYVVGGTYESKPDTLDSTYSFMKSAARLSAGIGFRVARTIGPSETQVP